MIPKELYFSMRARQAANGVESVLISKSIPQKLHWENASCAVGLFFRVCIRWPWRAVFSASTKSSFAHLHLIVSRFSFKASPTDSARNSPSALCEIFSRSFPSHSQGARQWNDGSSWKVPVLPSGLWSVIYLPHPILSLVFPRSKEDPPTLLIHPLHSSLNTFLARSFVDERNYDVRVFPIIISMFVLKMIVFRPSIEEEIRWNPLWISAALFETLGCWLSQVALASVLEVTTAEGMDGSSEVPPAFRWILRLEPSSSQKKQPSYGGACGNNNFYSSFCHLIAANNTRCQWRSLNLYKSALLTSKEHMPNSAYSRNTNHVHGHMQ